MSRYADMKNKKLWVFIGAVAVIFISDRIFGWSSYLGDRESLRFLEEIVEDNMLLAVAVYIVLTVIGCVALALPGIVFAALAGVLFGPVLGTVCCSVATTAGAMLAFLVGRFFLKDSIKPLVAKNKYLDKWLFGEADANGIFILMITRLVPLFPYNLQNFAYGITDIRFSTYSICSLVFMLPGTAMYTLGAAGIADREGRVLYLSSAVLLAVAVMGLSVFLKKKYVQKEQGQDG